MSVINCYTCVDICVHMCLKKCVDMCLNIGRLKFEADQIQFISDTHPVHIRYTSGTHPVDIRFILI